MDWILIKRNKYSKSMKKNNENQTCSQRDGKKRNEYQSSDNKWTWTVTFDVIVTRGVHEKWDKGRIEMGRLFLSFSSRLSR